MFVLNLIHVKLQYMPGTLLKWWHTGNSVYHIFVLSDNVLRRAKVRSALFGAVV